MADVLTKSIQFSELTKEDQKSLYETIKDAIESYFEEKGNEFYYDKEIDGCFKNVERESIPIEIGGMSINLYLNIVVHYRFVPAKDSVWYDRPPEYEDAKLKYFSVCSFDDIVLFDDIDDTNDDVRVNMYLSDYDLMSNLKSA